MSEAAAGKKTAWAWVAGTFFGVGLLKPGPGTWGSAAAGLLWLGAALSFPLSPARLAWLTAAATIVALSVGIPAATRVERESGREDPGHVVIDEAVGQWISLIHARPDLRHLLAAFLFFRLFDILKPWPARQLEHLPAGWGIMLDDVAAGLYALLLVQVLDRWIA